MDMKLRAINSPRIMISSTTDIFLLHISPLPEFYFGNLTVSRRELGQFFLAVVKWMSSKYVQIEPTEKYYKFRFIDNEFSQLSFAQYGGN